MQTKPEYPDVGNILSNNTIICKSRPLHDFSYGVCRDYLLVTTGRIVEMSCFHLPDGMILDYGKPVIRLNDNLSLRVIGQNAISNSLYATPERIGARAIVLYFRLKRRLELTNRLLVLIAEVWGIANVEPGAIPSWGDLKIVNKMKGN